MNSSRADASGGANENRDLGRGALAIAGVGFCPAARDLVRMTSSAGGWAQTPLLRIKQVLFVPIAAGCVEGGWA